MELVYITLNCVQTELIFWGCPFDCNGSDIILVVTGNAGIPDLYTEFAAAVHKSTNLPTCVIGHAGQVKVPDAESNVLNKEREYLYNLKGQLAHKLDLIYNHLDKKSKLHLIGHSMGTWMLLEILNEHDDITARVLSLNLLFPAMQKLAESPYGIKSSKIRKINCLMNLLFNLQYLPSNCIRSFFVGVHLKQNSLPAHYKERILKYLEPPVLKQIQFLLYEGLDHIRELNVSAFEKVKHLTNVIYSNHDGWAPVSYMDALKQFQPPLKTTEVDIDHSFHISPISSVTVADMVVDFIKSKS